MFSIVVVADADQARFLRVSGPPHARHIEEMPPIERPAASGALAEQHRTARSSAGRVQHVDSMPRVTASDFDPSASAEVRFAKSLAHQIDVFQQAGGIDDFTLLAAPHFLGLLRKHLADGTRKIVRLEISGDYVHSDLKTIMHAAYPV